MSEATRLLRRPPVAIGLVAAVVIGLLLLAGPDDEGPPLSPDGTGPLGTRALVLLLEELGADVDVTRAAPSADHDVALVLADDLGDDRRADLARWVEGGGTAVVADPASPLTPRTGGDPVAAPVRPQCGIAAFSDVGAVDPSGGIAYDAGEGVTCFDGFVVVDERGSGNLVAVGGAGALTNGAIGEADNAVLAAALLAPEDGTRVAFLEPPLPGSGSRSLTDLIGDGVRGGLWQLAVAFLLYALWRARRLGRPVGEPQPVELAASELTVAVGHLLQQAGRADQAGALLREDLRRSLADRLGLGPAAPPAQVAEVAAARTGIPAERLRAALDGPSVGGSDELVALATEAESLRQEVAHV